MSGTPRRYFVPRSLRKRQTISGTTSGTDSAYRRLFKAIAANTADDLKWQSAIWVLAGSTAERVWEHDLDEQAIIAGFSRIVHECLDDLAAADWIACLPLERVFCNFPEFTNFGEFTVVNAAGADLAQPVEVLLERFRSVLTANFGVNFIPNSEIDDSYLRLGAHYHMKSGCYVPRRPQLVLRVGRGEQRFERMAPTETRSQSTCALVAMQDCL